MQPVQKVQQAQIWCQVCGAYGNTYNRTSQTQLNSSWGNNQAQNQNFKQQAQTSNIEMSKQIMASQAQTQASYATLAANQDKMVADLKNQQLVIQASEKQMNQISQAQNTRPQRGLPSDTENPK